MAVFVSRRTRLEWPGAVYHVMSRGNRKGKIFQDDVDRRYFIETIRDTTIRYGIRPHALCLMNNHYHVVFDTPRQNLSRAMQHLNGLYAQSTNRRHGWTGHIFEARFHSPVVQRELYLRRVARYVVLNPVRAYLVDGPDKWPWSTYRATAGLEPPPDWLYSDWLDHAFDANTRAEAQARYRCYVNQPAARNIRIDPKARAIGSAAFRDAIADATDQKHRDRGLPTWSGAPGRPPLAQLFGDTPLSLAVRDGLIETAHVAHGYSLAEIARYLELDRSTVSRALSKRLKS